MTVLSSRKILEDNNGREHNSITSLTLTYKALSDVSCLAAFENLERLDLGFNNLTSVEALNSCVNLKWLSVAQNKLQSLKGLQGLTKLTVLNAGKNNIKSMDDVRSLVNLRALILNDNEITSICKLDQMKELNTLVLSRNPVSKIGDALDKTKSITKLSLSNCQLQTIDLSLTSCTELKELRLAHNEIKTLPVDLSHNARLQNLDVGNNLITKWSDLKVLSSLVNLRNLNLQGNPIAEKDTLVKKIKKLLPNLQILNSRPAEKVMRKEGHRTDSSLAEGDNLVVRKDVRTNPATGKKNSTKYLLSDEEGADDPLVGSRDGAKEKESNYKKPKRKELLKEQLSNAQENHVAEKKKSKLESKDAADDSEFPSANPHVDKDLKRKKGKKEKLPANAAPELVEEDAVATKGDRNSRKKLKQNAGSVIDDGATPFAELFAASYAAENDANRVQKMGTEIFADVDSGGAFVTLPTKNKKDKNKIKNKSHGNRATIADLFPADEVGLGGVSTWGD